MPDKEVLPIRVKENFRAAAVRYSEFTELRTIVNLVPGIGSAIDFIISNEVQKIQYKRIIDAMTYLKEEMSKIDEDKIDKTFVNSEAFSDLLLHFFDKVVRIKDRQKAILYSKILVGSIKIENVNERQFVEDMIDLLSDLSLLDLKIAQLIFVQQSDMPDKFDDDNNSELKFIVRSGWHNIVNDLGISEVDFDISLRKLERAGILKQLVGMYVGYSGGLYLITPAFERLMGFIRFHANEPLFV